MRARRQLDYAAAKGKANSGSTSQPAHGDLEALTRRRALQLSMHRGTGTHDELRDWYQAEAEIRAHLSDSGLEDVWFDETRPGAPPKRNGRTG